MTDEDKDTAAADEPAGFLARWGRRKSAARAAEAPLPVAAPATPAATPAETLPPPPGHADVALLTQDSDYTRFMSQDVDAGVQRAAMKKLFFSDPHFNLMDGLDTYIDDYNQADPIPLSVLRQMHQSKVLGLFALEEETAAQDPTHVALVATESQSPSHDNDHADLRLQQDDAAGRPGPEGSAGP
jgi:hypothetical protein